MTDESNVKRTSASNERQKRRPGQGKLHAQTADRAKKIEKSKKKKNRSKQVRRGAENRHVDNKGVVG